MADQVEHPRLRSVGAFDLRDLELLRPGNHRTPDKLVEQHDDRNHGGDSPQDRRRVSGTGGGLEGRSQAGQAEIARTQHEHFAGHQKKPATGDRHHGVPDQADGGIRQFHLNEALPPAEAIDLCRFAHLVRNALERSVKAEGHVPHLAGKDEQDCPRFDPQLPAGKQGHHGQHDARKEAEYGNGLQNVEQRDHEPLSPWVVRRDVAVDEREGKAQHIGDRNP